MQNTTRRLFLIIAVSVLVREELANKTVNYDTRIKAYRFEPKIKIIKKASQGKRSGLTCVFEKRVMNKNWCDCQQ